MAYTVAASIAWRSGSEWVAVATSTARRPPRMCRVRSGDVEGGVVDDERRLPRRVLGAGERQRDGLPGERGQVERPLGVPGGAVEVRERGDGGRVDLDSQRVAGAVPVPLGRIDVQEERERVVGAAGGQR